MIKELHVCCELFVDLQHSSESKEHALRRVVEILNENDISVSVNRSEIRNVEE